MSQQKKKEENQQEAFDVQQFLDEKGSASSGLKDLALIRKLWPYIRPHRVLLGFCLFLLIPLTASQVALPALVQYTIDGPIIHGNLKELAMMCGGYLALMGVHYVLKYYVMVLSQIVGQKIIYALRTDLYDHLQTLSPRFYNRTPIGKLVTRVTNDVENLSEMLSAGGLTILMDLTVIIGVLLFMTFSHWQLTLVTLLMVILIVGMLELLRRRSRRGHDRIRTHMAAMNTYFQESFSGMDIIQLYQREQKNVRDFRSLNQSNLKTCLQTVLYDCSMAAWAEYLTILTLILILGLGSLAIMQGVMTFGLLIAFFLYVQMVFEPIEDLADKYTIIQSGLTSIDKLMALFNETPDIQPPSSGLLSQKTETSTLQLAGAITFNHVRFGYQREKPVIRDLSFQIQPGEHVAIIGHTGAGKTTLIKLLTRFYDVDQGSIELDDIPLQELPLETVRKQVVTIQQDDFLFSRSLAENMTLDFKIHSRLEHDPTLQSHLFAILQQLKATNLLSKQKNDWTAPLKERGRDLSGGERQLLLFARAMYHNPAIFILDEATSAVDPTTERQIQQAMALASKGRTTLVIAHRLSTIRQADRALVLSQGRQVQFGTHEELVRQEGLYARFFQCRKALED